MGLVPLALASITYYIYTTIPVAILRRGHGIALTFFWAVILWIFYGIFMLLDTSRNPTIAAARETRKMKSSKKEPALCTMACVNMRNHVLACATTGAYFYWIHELLVETPYWKADQDYYRTSNVWYKSIGWYIFSMVVLYVIYDIVFWVGHRIMHTAPVYKNVHKLHHTSFATTAICCHYMTVTDFMLELELPGLVCFLAVDLLKLAPGAMLAFMLMGSTNGASVHSGWKLGIYCIPLLTSAESHYWHHNRLKCNYAIGLVDACAGTQQGLPEKYRAACDQVPEPKNQADENPEHAPLLSESTPREDLADGLCTSDAGAKYTITH